MGESALENRLPWVCPSCLDNGDSFRLTLNGSAATCERGHQFDRAKQGYINLHLPHKKRSKAPGDDESMMSARREFLAQGHYQCLMNALVSALKDCTSQENIKGLDIGCGEGSYIRYLSNHIINIDWLGIDISKPAIKKAAGANKQTFFAVASGSGIPLPAGELDLALVVFAPLDVTELQRVLKKGGVLVRVSPAKNHFIELKRELYETVTLHEAPTTLSGFNVEQEMSVCETLHLDNVSLQLLLAMTPLQWRGDNDKKTLLKQVENFDITCDFIIQVMRYE